MGFNWNMWKHGIKKKTLMIRGVYRKLLIYSEKEDIQAMSKHISIIIRPHLIKKGVHIYNVL